MADNEPATAVPAPGTPKAVASMQAAPTRWQIVAGLAVLALAAWLTLLFFEGDSCTDAGGAFHALAYHCEIAGGKHYIPLAWKARWPFWAFYGLFTLLVAAPLCALGAGLAAGLVCGLRSLWSDVVRTGAASRRPSP